jgi:hypothetical protein
MRVGLRIRLLVLVGRLRLGVRRLRCRCDSLNGIGTGIGPLTYLFLTIIFGSSILNLFPSRGLRLIFIFSFLRPGFLGFHNPAFPQGQLDNIDRLSLSDTFHAFIYSCTCIKRFLSYLFLTKFVVPSQRHT